MQPQEFAAAVWHLVQLPSIRRAVMRQCPEMMVLEEWARFFGQAKIDRMAEDHYLAFCRLVVNSPAPPDEMAETT